MGRIVGLVSVLIVAWAGAAAGQVAVPELSPAATRLYSSYLPVTPMTSLTPENPAALQWGAPSRLGAGYLEGVMSDGTLPGDSTEFNGSLAGLRWVREHVAMAAESMRYAVDFPEVPPAPIPRRERKQTSLALSFTWPDSLAWGLSGERYSATDLPGSAVEHLDSDGWVIGLSWRPGEIFALGAAIGEEEATLDGPAFMGQAERSHHMVGIGLRGTGWLIWRLEADLFHRDDYKDGTGAVIQPGYDLSLYTVEAIWRVWLLGYSAYSATAFTGTSNTLSGYSADFGYAPLSGFTITYRFEHSEATAGATQLASEEIDSLQISWQF